VDASHAPKLSDFIDKCLKRPRRSAAIDVYQNIYYDERLSSDFKVYWATIVQNASRTPGKAVPDQQLQVAIRRDWVRQRWEKETAEVRNCVYEEIEERYQNAIREHNRKWFDEGMSEEELAE
jgi:hypothetical protein